MLQRDTLDWQFQVVAGESLADDARHCRDGPV